MKIVTTIARSLLGVIFVVFGSNLFLHFIPMPPPPEGPARDVNILAFHALMAPAGLGLAIVVSALALFLVWRYRENFAGLVRPPQPARRQQSILDARSQPAAAANS